MARAKIRRQSNTEDCEEIHRIQKWDPVSETETVVEVVVGQEYRVSEGRQRGRHCIVTGFAWTYDGKDRMAEVRYVSTGRPGRVWICDLEKVDAADAQAANMLN